MAGERILKLPGHIDTHVHARQFDTNTSYFDTKGNQKPNSETFVTVSRAALSGGITQILLMPNTVIPITTEERVKRELQAIEKAGVYVDMGVHIAGNRESLVIKKVQII